MRQNEYLTCRFIHVISMWNLHVYLSMSVKGKGKEKLNQSSETPRALDFFVCVFCASFVLCLLAFLGLMPHWTISDVVSLCATASLCRLEFQYGFSLPVPQLESVCGGVCTAVCLCSGSSHFYA